MSQHTEDLVVGLCRVIFVLFLAYLLWPFITEIPT